MFHQALIDYLNQQTPAYGHGNDTFKVTYVPCGDQLIVSPAVCSDPYVPPIVIDNATPVSEPGTALILIAGLLMVKFRRRV